MRRVELESEVVFWRRGRWEVVEGVGHGVEELDGVGKGR